MSKRMTWDEIENAFPNEWVVVGHATAEEAPVAREGVLLAHTPDIDEAYRRAGQSTGRLALWFVGQPPADGFAALGCIARSR